MSMVQCQLWMGGLEPYMTESFILGSFERMGEKPLNVKVMRNKVTGEPAGYCFVHFENDDEAIDAMHKLNGKLIPNTNPPIRFRLNTATNQGKVLMGEKEFSLWVGDLTPEVDDYTLFKTFAARYQSIKAAKVILDSSGFSKGFGFLRFGSEDEQKHCLANMNGFKGLGTKNIKISNAIPKYSKNYQGMHNAGQGAQGYPANQDYSHYYDTSTYWPNYGWGNYYDPSNSQSNYAQYNYMMPGQTTSSSSDQPTSQYSSSQYQYPSTNTTMAPLPTQQPSQQPQTDPDLELIDHPKPPNMEEENSEKSESICSFWDALQNSKWTSPDLFESEITKMKYSLVET